MSVTIVEKTLEQLKTSKKALLQTNYVAKCVASDDRFLGYKKRVELEITEADDETKYNTELTSYETYTLSYRTKRDLIAAATTRAELDAIDINL